MIKKINSALAYLREKKCLVALGTALSVMFPVFLAISAENNHLQSLPALLSFLTTQFGPFLFSVLILGLIYTSVLLLFGRAWIPASIMGFFIYAFSYIEFYKFDASGSHFLISDLSLAQNLDDISGFAHIRLTPYIIVNALLLIIYIAALYVFAPPLKIKIKLRIPIGVAATALSFLVLFTSLSSPLYRLFGVDNQIVHNAFVAQAKFKADGLVSFLSSEASYLFSKRPSKPKNYNKETILDLLLPPAENPKGISPNVIVILSESFADFRRLSKELAPDSAYESFDRACELGFSSTVLMPTFGGYTCRTEFELLAGLPMAALNNPVLPQKMFSRDIGGIASLFSDYGYKTVYIHPFKSDFYGRDRIYPHYGFQKLLFSKDLDDGRTFHGYTDDGVVFDAALEEIVKSEEPAFVFVTTMQNHTPYNAFYDGMTSELEYFLRGVEHSDARLGELLDAIDNLEEPTVLLFLGDHFPFFALKGNTYQQQGFDNTNCYELFVQKYFIYTNYESTYEAFPRDTISLFYLPHCLLSFAQQGNLPKFSTTILAAMSRSPLYTSATGQVLVPNEALDALTYDRVLGRGYTVRQP